MPIADGERSCRIPTRLCFAYDAGAANPSRSGRVEVRLRTAQAQDIAALLARLAADD